MDAIRRGSMKTWIYTVAALGLTTGAFGQGQSESHEPPALGIAWAKGELNGAPPSGQAHHTNSPNMLFHNGKIMTTAVTEAIFWGTSWGSYSGDKMTGMDNWHIGFSSSNYAKTS